MAEIIPVDGMNKDTDFVNAIWQKVAGKLKATHGDATYNSWFKSLELLSIDGGEATIGAPTRFVREWVLSHYYDDVMVFLKSECADVKCLDFRINHKKANVVTSFLPKGSKVFNDNVNVAKKTAEPISLDDLEVYLDPRLTFDNFIVAPSNELAYAAAKSIAESSEVIPGSNPLFLYGGVGLGKTHLMQAIAHHVKENNPTRKVLYLSAEKFAYQFVKALRNKNIVAFKEYFRSVDVLMVDDIQFICGKNSTQEEFFHTFNALIDNNKQLILSGDRSPSDLDGLEDRVKSRLGWGLVADINTTTFELRLGILQSRIEAMNIDVPNNVLEFIARKISSNVRELEGALNKVVAHSNLMKRDITLEGAQTILRDLLRCNQKTITIDDIKKAVADHCNVKISDMNSARRARNVARPRQVAMYLSKRLTPSSLPEIGRKFGGRDHTTVMHAVKKVEELCGNDSDFQEDVRLMTKMLEN